MIIKNPTGQGIRSDPAGSGEYGARRSGGRRKHRGIDLLCDPGQSIKAPISGKIIRGARPYAKDARYHGFLIRGAEMEIKIFYCKLLPGMIGKTVRRGQVVAVAEDVTKKHGGGMLPHVHLEITNINPKTFMEDLKDE